MELLIVLLLIPLGLTVLECIADELSGRAQQSREVHKRISDGFEDLQKGFRKLQESLRKKSEEQQRFLDSLKR